MASLIGVEQLVGIERLFAVMEFWLLTVCIKIYDWTGYVPSVSELLMVAGLSVATWVWWEWRQWPKVGK
jgi:hypothetical protein